MNYKTFINTYWIHLENHCLPAIWKLSHLITYIKWPLSIYFNGISYTTNVVFRKLQSPAQLSTSLYLVPFNIHKWKLYSIWNHKDFRHIPVKFSQQIYTDPMYKKSGNLRKVFIPITALTIDHKLWNISILITA